jgi:hypothetical protein
MQASAAAKPDPATPALISRCLIGIEALAEVYFQ